MNIPAPLANMVNTSSDTQKMAAPVGTIESRGANG